MPTPRFAPIVRLAGLAACALALAVPCRAQLVFHVDLKTAPLIGHPAGPFSLDFDLLDGSGTGDANNVVTLSDFAFGVGGEPSGSPVRTGGASGSLASGVTLTDSSFFNDFHEGFTPGGLLSFDVSLTTNVDAGGTPDEFSFKILDKTGFEIPTTGFGDKLLLVDITGSNPTIQRFAGDPSRTPNGGGEGIALFAPDVSFRGQPAAVPEPSALAFLIAAPVAFALRLRRRVR